MPQASTSNTLHIVNHLFVLLLFRRLQLLLLLQFHCTGTSHSEVPDLPCWKTATLPTPPSSPQMAKFLRRASRRALVKQRWLLNFHRRSVLLRHTQRARHTCHYYFTTALPRECLAAITHHSVCTTSYAIFVPLSSRLSASMSLQTSYRRCRASS